MLEDFDLESFDLEDGDLDDDDNNDGADSGLQKRLRKVTKQRREALARIGELEAEVKQLEKRAATADTLSDQVKSLKGQLVQQEAATARKLELVDAGVTDGDARDYLLHRYERLGEDAPEFGKWLTKQKAEASGFLADMFGGDGGDGGDGDGKKGGEGEKKGDDGDGKKGGRGGYNVDGGTKGGRGKGSDGLSMDAILDPNTPFSELKGKMRDSYGWTGPLAGQSKGE